MWIVNSFFFFSKFFPPFHPQQMFFPSEVFAMYRFVSKRSSSSLNLDSASLNDVRAERAAIALSVGLSWPPERYTKTRGRPSWQQPWERALQEHILNHHELPHGIRLQRPAWWRPGEAFDPRQPPQPLHSLNTSPAAALPSAARSTSTPSPATGFSTCWTSGGKRAAMGHAAVLVRGPASVPQNVRRDQPEHSLPLETERATSRDARQ